MLSPLPGRPQSTLAAPGPGSGGARPCSRHCPDARSPVCGGPRRVALLIGCKVQGYRVSKGPTRPRPGEKPGFPAPGDSTMRIGFRNQQPRRSVQFWHPAGPGRAGGGGAPVSLPSAAATCAAATAAAEPPEEPPGTRSVSHGFRDTCAVETASVTGLGLRAWPLVVEAPRPRHCTGRCMHVRLDVRVAACMHGASVSSGMDSAVRGDRRADQTIGIIDRRADQIDM